MKTPIIWIYDEDEAVLFNWPTGRVYAHIWNDQFGKYYPTLYLSPWEAINCWIHKKPDMFVKTKWISLFRLRIECFRLKDLTGMIDAIGETNKYFTMF